MSNTRTALSVWDMCNDGIPSAKRRRLDHQPVISNATVDSEFFERRSEQEYANANNLQASSSRGFEVVEHWLPESAPDVWSWTTAASGSFPLQTDHIAIPAENGSRGQEEVCFGMISKLPVVLQQGLHFGAAAEVPVIFADFYTNKLLSKFDRSVSGTLSNRDWTILCSISQEQDVHLQMVVSINNTAVTKGSQTAYLSAIIYGPLEIFDDIGEYFSDNDLFLQDPWNCYRNVRYRNPQRLSGLDQDAPLTFDHFGPNARCGTVSSPIDMLQGFESKQDISEAKVPKALQTRLYKHQKKALHFMLKRERGWDLQKEHSDLWSKMMLSTGPFYMNNVTGRPQQEAPAPFRGGILADHMGLGKTLSIISLIASDKKHSTTSPGSDQGTSSCRAMDPGRETSMSADGMRPMRNTTLLIVPSSLLQTWENELQKHLIPGAIKWVRNYGSQRLKNDAEIHQYDLVLTTLQTASSEYRKLSTTPSILFSTQWRRLVLDEAHYIRNSNTVTARAVSAIEASSRWAVTGTPVQNKLTDFTSLLQFLQVYPYSNPRYFESDITDLWKSGKDEEAIERLKALVQFITLRRSIATVELPDRIDTIQRLDFSSEELAQYRDFESTVVSILDDATHSEHHKIGSYTNTLAKINILRRFCNLGLSAPNLRDNMASSLARDEYSSWNTVAAKKTFDALASLGEAQCVLCDLENKPEDELLLTCETPCAKLTQCLRFICTTCCRPTPKPASYCDHEPTCPVAIISINTPSSGRSTPRPETKTLVTTVPTKADALIAELKSCPEEKSVVFSSWTTTLNMVQSSLQVHGIQYARVDGKTRQRDKILGTFRFDPKVRVLLLTIQCGAEGLNLTAASRVYMMEPQWNPTIEAQALSRVHRLGQTKRVTTVRFIMNNTIEEHIIRVQDRKKHLTQLMLSQGSLQNESGNFLKSLRSLLR